MYTFPVDDVEPLPEMDCAGDPLSALELAQLRARGEEVDHAESNLTIPLHGSLTHGLMAAVHRAYSDHLPLRLAPDDIWLTLVEGFGYHINLNAEKYRSQFVAHEGKKELIVAVETSYFPGNPDNDWGAVLGRFAGALLEQAGPAHSLVVSDWSTTGPVEKAASQVALMSAMQSYFSYGMATACGIPSITLEGTAGDWARLRERARGLASYGLEAWGAALDPILAQFVAAAEGNPQKDFWQRIYKLHNMSGGPYIGGWLTVLYPYLVREKEKVPNTDLGWEQGRARFQTSDFASDFNGVPVTWYHGSHRVELQFRAGFLGYGREPASGAVRPAIGWAVTRKVASLSPEARKAMNGAVRKLVAEELE